MEMNIITDKFIEWIYSRIQDNEDNGPSLVDWDNGYMCGYHDAMVEVLDHLGVEHDKEYYN